MDRTENDYIEKVNVRDLAKAYGTPLYVYSQARVVENYNRLKAALSPLYSKTLILYAVKANLNLSILELLREQGAGADCNSPGELAHAIRAGFQAEKTLYSGNYESEDDLRAAVAAGVLLNLDSE